MPVPSSSPSCSANAVTLIMLIGEVGKYRTSSSRSVCEAPSSSFHFHSTVPMPEGLFILPPIVATIPDVVLLKVTNIFLSLHM